MCFIVVINANKRRTETPIGIGGSIGGSTRVQKRLKTDKKGEKPQFWDFGGPFLTKTQKMKERVANFLNRDFVYKPHCSGDNFFNKSESENATFLSK